VRFRPALTGPGNRPARARRARCVSRVVPDAGPGLPWDDRAVFRTVLIVDDHDGFRAGARALLEADGFEVLGEAADGAAALEAFRRLRPEVVLLDVQLPGIDGFEVAERLAAEADPPAVVLISSRGPDSYRPQLATSPVRGFIAKGELSGECLAGLVF
jgi:DNA-binding NarL/FixJ family response regulator